MSRPSPPQPAGSKAFACPGNTTRSRLCGRALEVVSAWLRPGALVSGPHHLTEIRPCCAEAAGSSFAETTAKCPRRRPGLSPSLAGPGPRVRGHICRSEVLLKSRGQSSQTLADSGGTATDDKQQHSLRAETSTRSSPLISTLSPPRMRTLSTL